ncbi:MAG TPA: ABC transporter substrate-binding protein [Acidimicrobiales bacterium]|nr:ABC transporter substrate-binding protein [Acidimicrobiales bacterium]
MVKSVSGGGTRWRDRSVHRSVHHRLGAPAALSVVMGVLVTLAPAIPSASASSAPSAAVKVLDNASRSSRGVSVTKINVVFPVSNLTTLSSNFGFLGDAEFAAQTKAIHTYVNAANAHGGINGRKINPMIVNFDPTSESGMRALCKQWTEGSPPVFAVVDGLGSWTGDNQLCITQEGHTPFIAQWTTTTNWTKAGAPYLWWTGPDQASILATLVAWAKGAHLMGGNRKLAIVAGDRASDQKALKSYLLPDLKRAGIPAPMVETIPANPSDTASTGSAAPLIVQHLQAAGINSVIPLIPFNALFPYLQAEAQQHYYPKLLLSDYEGSINVTLGLIPAPYEKELNGQEGITAETLGGVDGPTSLVGQGGYDAGVANCYKIWHAANPKPISGQTLIHGEAASPYIEEQGPTAGWCQGIELFTAAAKKAGRNLTRRSFVQAMAGIKKFTGTYSPTLSFRPGKFAGPDQYQVVQLHNNVPASSACALTYQKITQGTCWRVVQSWKPLVTS